MTTAARRVGYLVNHYPKVSHSFIRREIMALERAGVPVVRIAVRGWNDALVDPADLAERELTTYVLKAGATRLLRSVLAAALTRPRQMVAAAGLALSMWRSSDRSLVHHLAYLVEACEVERLLRERGAQHLHAHFGTNPAQVAMLAHALGGPPYSFTVHGPEEFDKPEALGLGEKGRRAAFVVAISSYGRSQLYRWLAPAHWNRVQVVHCGLEPEFHLGAPDGPSAAPTLVCVGRLCEQKGQLLLLHAMQRVVAKGIELDLVLAGDGEMRAQIEALIDRLALRSRVRITGWIDGSTVRAEILAARALVLPSFAEGLPVVIMEAMALRRPVISTYVAGIPELIVDGVTGWLVPPGDVERLADAIEACLAASPAELALMGQHGHRRVVDRHDIDAEAAKLATLFATGVGP